MHKFARLLASCRDSFEFSGGVLGWRVTVLLFFTFGALTPVRGQVAEVQQFAAQEQAFSRGSDLFHAAQAERRFVAQQEQDFGPESLPVASSLHRLARLYLRLNKPLQAEPLLLRSLAISQKVATPENPLATANLKFLVKLYVQLGHKVKAQARYNQLLGYQTQWLTNYAQQHGTTQLAQSELLFILNMLNDLQPQDMTPQQLLQALPFYAQLLALQEQDKSNDLFPSILRLAQTYRLLGQYAHAELLLQRALKLEVPMQIPGSPRIALVLNELALLYRAQGRGLDALPLARRATGLYQQRIGRGHTAQDRMYEATSNRQGFLNHLALLADNPVHESHAALVDEAFQLGQWAQASVTAVAFSTMTARFASGSNALAERVRMHQDAETLLGQKDAQLLKLLGMRAGQRNFEVETSLREDIAILEQKMVETNTELARLFPRFQELTRPDALPIRAAQALLKANEAMLVYSVGSSDSFLWVVTARDAEFMSLHCDGPALANAIATVRAQLELNENGHQRRVSTDVLNRLYQQLIEPARPFLAGVDHLLLVPEGPLQSLPFGMLIPSQSTGITAEPLDYGQIDWLIKHFDLSVLPSVGTLQSMRLFAQPSTAMQPFAGFGDPRTGESVLFGNQTQRGIDSKAGNHSVSIPTSELADVDALRELPRLTETADELNSLARATGANEDTVWLGDQATESRVKSQDLSRYRMLAFATHAVMAGELNGLSQPGLVFTPPVVASANDDGYLTAEEIAMLKLNADWVLLSACNTAASDGTPGAEGFSGLTKAFVYAGARSLLVSHWSVESKAAMKLSTGAMQAYESSLGLSKAGALRQSMLSLMQVPGYSHPMYWAPFVLVGEGSR